MVNSIGGTVRRFATLDGQTATLKQYTSSGTDSYGDPDWDSPSTQTIEVLEAESGAKAQQTPAGDNVQYDAVLQVENNVTIEDAEANSDDRADEIEIGDRAYKVLEVKTKMGVQHVTARRIDK